MFHSNIPLLSPLFAAIVAAEFQLYHYYDANTLTEAWNLTTSCISALNTTVKCDERVSTLIGSGIDNNYWYMDNLTRLCTADCQASLHSWGNSVESACYGQTIWQSGAQVQAKALTHSFTHNADIACMKDSHSNWCFFESQSWQGSDYIRWDPLLCADLEDLPPQCNDSTFDPDEISPDMSALTNLYDSKLYCSECFLKIMRQRLLDPWLSQSNFTDYLIGEFDDLQRKCSTTLPYSTSSSTLYIGSATSTPTTINSTTGAPSATPTCIGQLVQPKDDFLTCNDLSDTYGVSTGDARVATGDFVCQFTSTICLPLPCKLDTVWDSPSCSDLARRYSNSTYNVTQAQFLSWNSNIQGSCDGVALGQRVCKGAPGGTFPQPRPSITAPGATGTAVYYTAATAAYPTQIGSIKECGNYYLVQPGDNCQTVAIQFGLNFSQLQEYNTYLYNNCSNLWKDYDVCVAPVMPQTVSQNGTCPPGVTCVGSAFGECCSPFGYCGSNASYCASSGDGTATTNGSCGPDHGGTTCTNPSFGDCCSIYGYCGTGPDFCGAGNCYSGHCATDIGGPSTNGECGPNFAGNKTCTGTQFGTCCSRSGYCGSTNDYCLGTNCYSGACT